MQFIYINNNTKNGWILNNQPSGVLNCNNSETGLPCFKIVLLHVQWNETTLTNCTLFTAITKCDKIKTAAT